MANQLEGGTISTIELAGFRFMLLAWLVAALVGIYAGYAYYRQDSALNGWLEIVNGPFKCQQVFKTQIPECSEEAPWSKIICQSALNHHCPSVTRDDPTLARLNEEHADWLATYDVSRDVALYLFLLAPIVFYAIRWGLTGRIRPLWFFKK